MCARPHAFHVSKVLIVSLTAGEKILGGRYEIEGVLGKGSMGVVVGAVHLRSGTRVAVKVLAELDPTNAELMLKRFEREAKLLSRVTSHPNIVSLLDHGALPSGEPCLVMEYVEGTDLERVLEREGSLAWRSVVPIARQILEALEAVHGAGVLHRDLKPSNVLLTGEALDVVKLADFGVAKQLDDEATRLTRTGRIVGTPLYMAPEQMLQLPMTTSSDLYALGLMLHELIAGAIPFGKNLKGVRRRLRDELPMPNSPSHRPQVPAALRELIVNMTRIDPDERLDLVEALAAFDALDLTEDGPSLFEVTDPGFSLARPSLPSREAHGLLIARLGSRVLRRRFERKQLDQYVKGIGTAIVVDNTDWVASLTCDDADTLEATIEALVDTIAVVHVDSSCVLSLIHI